VLGDPRERRVGVVPAVGAQRADVEVDADEAAALRDRVELVVQQVAAVRAEGVDAGVAGDQRPGVELGDVPEAGGVEMAEVDRDAELTAAAHQPLAGLGEPRPGVGRRRELERDAVRERVRAAPDEPERAQAGRVPDLERIEVGVDRLRALEVEHDAERLAGQAGVEVGGVADEPDRAVRGFEQPEQPRAERADRAGGLLPVDRRGVGDLVAAGRTLDVPVAGRRQHGEHARGEPARAGARDRDRGGLLVEDRRVGRALLVEVAEHVVVAVDDRSHALQPTMPR
jgi:hypothetical protein